MSKKAKKCYNGVMFNYISTEDFNEIVGSDYDPDLMVDILSSYAEFLSDKKSASSLNKGEGLMGGVDYKKVPYQLGEVDCKIETKEDVKLWIIAIHIFTHCNIGNATYDIPHWWIKANTMLKAIGVQSKSPVQTRRLIAGLKTLIQEKGEKFMLRWEEKENPSLIGTKRCYIVFDMDLYKNLCENLK